MKIHKLVTRSAVLPLAMLMFSIPAFAQFVPGSNASTTISADNADYRGDVTILTGQVDVRQEDVRILADKMSVYGASADGLTQNAFTRIVAEGNFYYLTSEQEVRGDKGVYSKQDNTFVITGGVILKQKDGNIISGDTLYYNLTTRHARVVGNCEGRRCGSNGRVNILIKNTKSQSAS